MIALGHSILEEVGSYQVELYCLTFFNYDDFDVSVELKIISENMYIPEYSIEGTNGFTKFGTLSSFKTRELALCKVEEYIKHLLDNQGVKTD